MKLVLVTFAAILGSCSAEILDLQDPTGVYLDAPEGTICEQQSMQQAERVYIQCMSNGFFPESLCEQQRENRRLALMELCNDPQQCEDDAQRQYEAYTNQCGDDELCLNEGNQIRSQLKFQCFN